MEGIPSTEFTLRVSKGSGHVRLGDGRSYEINRQGYDLKTIEDRVCSIFKIATEELYARSTEKVKASARGLFCYWAVRELGYGLT